MGTLPQIMGQCSQQLDKGTLVSYKISKLIAQTGNAHNVGESLILPAVSIILSDVMNLNARDTVQAIPLSNSTVCRRIDEMALDVEDQLVALLRLKKFSLQVDETTLQDNDALLMAYVRFWNANTLMEEMLFVRKIRSDTKGLTMFGEIQNYFNEKSIPFQNVIACSTDGAASIVGRYRGFIAHLKTMLPSVFTIHCVIHREHLVSKKVGDQEKEPRGNLRAVGKHEVAFGSGQRPGEKAHDQFRAVQKVEGTFGSVEGEPVAAHLWSNGELRFQNPKTGKKQPLASRAMLAPDDVATRSWFTRFLSVSLLRRRICDELKQHGVVVLSFKLIIALQLNGLVLQFIGYVSWFYIEWNGEDVQLHLSTFHIVESFAKRFK
ncbi:hypothetical protein TTRE_0000281401 [Trichuris trichiura]|uniref:Uncharacterized protein n=1 Tax=Trichuris trichiura TaxID=36087 RepID=A0A077Z3X3_TRITR|nr:hypothetical protein TTRE_0000281401 [Trichuris trichiura]